jgi:hypothetical protein
MAQAALDGQVHRAHPGCPHTHAASVRAQPSTAWLQVGLHTASQAMSTWAILTPGSKRDWCRIQLSLSAQLQLHAGRWQGGRGPTGHRGPARRRPAAARQTERPRHTAGVHRTPRPWPEAELMSGAQRGQRRLHDHGHREEGGLRHINKPPDRALDARKGAPAAQPVRRRPEPAPCRMPFPDHDEGALRRTEQVGGFSDYRRRRGDHGALCHQMRRGGRARGGGDDVARLRSRSRVSDRCLAKARQPRAPGRRSRLPAGPTPQR